MLVRCASVLVLVVCALIYEIVCNDWARPFSDTIVQAGLVAFGSSIGFAYGLVGINATRSTADICQTQYSGGGWRTGFALGSRPSTGEFRVNR